MRIEEVLVRRGVIDARQLELARQQAGDRRLDHVVTELGYASEDSVLSALSDELGMRCVDLRETRIDTALLAEFPTAAMFRHSLLPVARKGDSVVVFIEDYDGNLYEIKEKR